MGGTEEHFGLFINNGAKTGLTSLSCTTFRQFWPLARELDFKIEQFELWIINENPVADSGEILTVGANGYQEKQFGLLSDNLDLSKLTRDLKMETEQDISTKVRDAAGPSPKNDLEYTSISKTKITPAKKGNRMVEETIEETNTKVSTAVVQEALQKQMKRSKGEQCRQAIFTRTEQRCGGNSDGLVKDVHSRRCVQKFNKEWSRSPLSESRNVKTPQEEKGRRGFVRPSEGQGDSINRNPKPREVSDGGLVHPGFKPKQEPSLPLSSQIQEKLSNDASSLSTTKKNINDVPFIRYQLRRNGKPLVDVQVQVGKSKILPPTCRMSSNKFCACIVKSPCNCKAMQTSSIATPDNNTEKIKSNKSVNIFNSSKVAETLPTVPYSSATNKIEIDSKGISSTASKDVQESCSAAGCRCSSSTETSNDWEGGDISNTLDRLKLKSECGCQFNTTVLGNQDVASKCISDAECKITQTLCLKTVNKLKDASSSMCSCVLGPKDQGVANSFQEKDHMTTGISVSGPSFSSKKETQELTRSSRKSKISLGWEESENSSKFIPSTPSDITHKSSNKKGPKPLAVGRIVSLVKPPLSTDDVDESCLSSYAGSCRNKNVLLGSGGSIKSSNSISPTFQALGNKDKPLTCSYQDKQPLSTKITNKSQLISKKETLCLTESSKKSYTSWKSEANILFGMPIPPTCLNCRGFVKTTGCQCKTRASFELVPILEQAPALLQQHRPSERSSILKSETESKRGSSAVLVNKSDNNNTSGCSVCSCDTTVKSSAKHCRSSPYCRHSGSEHKPGSKRCFCKSKTINNLNNSWKDTTITENSIVSRSKDILQAEGTNSAKKSCQCSLPRSCFPQFPEDRIQVDDGMKKCGCGTHAGAVIRFPTFPDLPEEESETVNITHSSETAIGSGVVAGVVAGTEGPGNEKKGDCPCIEDDGTIIILNVSKCNTMEALEKIVRELDIKYHPVMPQRLLPLTADSSTKSKPCNAAEGFDRDAIKRLLDSKMMGQPKEQSELKSEPPTE